MTYLERLQSLLASLTAAYVDASACRMYSVKGQAWDIADNLGRMIKDLRQDIRRAQQLEGKE